MITNDMFQDLIDTVLYVCCSSIESDSVVYSVTEQLKLAPIGRHSDK